MNDAEGTRSNTKMDNVPKELDEAYSLACNRDYVHAFEICDSYIRSNPSFSDGFRTDLKSLPIRVISMTL